MHILRLTFKHVFWILMALVLFFIAVIAGLYQESKKGD
jgi:cbb3-type cytochrome oxidase subunit 3